MEIELTDNSEIVKEEMQAAVLRALEKCGLTAEGYAKLLCPVDTGNLRNSITHQVNEGEPAVYMGAQANTPPMWSRGLGDITPAAGPHPGVY